MGTLHSDFMVKGTWKNENSAIVRSRRESSKKGIFYIILWRADFAEFIAKLVRKIALSSAKNAVNRKLILILHEPEVPEFVRKYMEKKEK